MTITLRSTALLTDYVRTVDKIATLSRQLKELEKHEANTRPDVITEIGDRREVAIRGQVRVLRLAEKTSVSAAVDQDALVAEAKRVGVKVSTQPAEYVHSSTLRAAVDAGKIGDEFIERKVTQIIEVI